MTKKLPPKTKPAAAPEPKKSTKDAVRALYGVKEPPAEERREMPSPPVIEHAKSPVSEPKPVVVSAPSVTVTETVTPPWNAHQNNLGADLSVPLVPTEITEHRQRSLVARTWPMILVGTVVAVGVGLGGYRLYQMKAPLSGAKPENKATLASFETKKLGDEVRKLMVLPATGDPTVATVTDVEKLKTQPFFADAQNGDKVLIFTDAKKAILYRPALKRIVDVTTVSSLPASNAATGAATPTATKPTAAATPTVAKAPSFVLLNGTTKTGLTKTYTTELKKLVSDAKVADTDVAKKRDYTQSVLVDATGKQNARAQELAKTLGLTLSLLPAGEATPPSGIDFVVILGADRK